MFKIYSLVVLLIVLVVGVVGFALPFCFSADDSVLVAIGALLMFALIPTVILIIQSIVKGVKFQMNKKMSVLMVLLCVLLFSACSKVPVGHLGVKVYLLGTNKGVDSEILGPGRYWIGYNEELHLFPTFTQNYIWTAADDEGSPNNESITFQTKEGMDVNADFGISYHIEAEKVPTIFQKYRKGIDEITDIYLRNMTRDALNVIASTEPVDYVYGKGKAALILRAEEMVKDQVAGLGIVIEKIYLTGSMRLPPEVIKALNRKIEATQKAEMVENELRSAEAEARKVVAAAEGKASALLKEATAQAQANDLLSKSITPELVRYTAIKRWDGVLPKLTGGNSVIPMIDLK